MDHSRQARHAGLLVCALLLVVYVATAAPSITFWDASEFATAIGTFGIPHPPGTPLYVALGAALWHLVPGLSPAQAGTLLSALATALACGIAAWLIVRVSGNRALGIVAGVSAGAMGTVWTNATETEVYAVSLLSVAIQIAAAWRAHSRNDDRARILLCFVAALSIPLHLSALVATPAALLLAMTERDGAVQWRILVDAAVLVVATVLLSHGSWYLAFACVAYVALDSQLHGPRAHWCLRAAAVTLLGWSAVAIMLIRARQAPFLNQGDPDTFVKLLNVMSRAQYDVAGLWPRRAPFWLQVGNIGQYADWQVALGLWNDVTPSWFRTPFTVLAAGLGVRGAVAHWRSHRVTATAMLCLMLLATLGVCVQLNLLSGPSFGFGILADSAPREARDREYFFALAFWCWGLWIGAGAWVLARRTRRPMLLAAVAPLLMIAGNWRAMRRDVMPDKQIAATMASEFLTDTPFGALLFTAGDNDSYPLWYRQAVDSVRRDVQVVVTSLLPANWYFREAASRGVHLVADTAIAPVAVLRAGALAQRQLDLRGTIAVSIALPSYFRAELGRLSGVTCWRREGLVDVGTRREVCPPRIDAERNFASAQRMGPLVRARTRSSLDGMVGAFQELARCPELATTVVLQGVASLDSASRRLLDITCNLR